MDAFLIDHGLEILFGVLSIIFAVIALRYTIKDHRTNVEGIIDESEQIQLYLNRTATLRALRDIYEDAKPGDTVWGQCVGCRAYSADVREVVLKAAGRGIHFKILVNANAPTKNELRSIFESLRNAEVKEATDNTIRIAGLSDKEVVVAFPTANSYTAVRIREPSILKLIKDYFDNRWTSI